MNSRETLRYRCGMAGEQGEARRLRPRRWVLAALAVAVVAIPVVIGVVISLLAPGAGTAPTAATTAGFTPVAPSATPRAPARVVASDTLPVPDGPGAIVALLTHPTTLRATPGGPALARLSTRTQFGSPETVLVVRHVGRWLGVVATEAGNDRLGWVSLGAVTLARISWELKVSLAQRRLTVLEAGRVIHRYTVAIGQPGAPTPPGRFAVTDRLSTGTDTGPYGCCILALSARSPHAIQGWDGGDRIAIHSTPEVGSIGQAASHGCVRVTLAEGRWLLSHIPLGTPTLISS